MLIYFCVLTYEDLNNSHIVLFDIHREYKDAFPGCNYIEASNLNLPYWLLNETELEELFLDSGDRNNYNQTSILRRTIIENKQKFNPNEKIPCSLNLFPIGYKTNIQFTSKVCSSKALIVHIFGRLVAALLAFNS